MLPAAADALSDTIAMIYHVEDHRDTALLSAPGEAVSSALAREIEAASTEMRYAPLLDVS